MDKKNLDKAWNINYRDSEEPEGIEIRGYDFNKPFNFEEMIKTYASTGFQASHLHKAIEILKKMKESREKEGTRVFLGFTSNMITSGLRDVIRFLVEHKYVDALVTTGGGVEEDIIKCIKPFVLGDFKVPGAPLRNAGVNRTGNIFVPVSRYVAYEKFLTPILDEILEDQKKTGKIYNPSDIIKILGEKIDNKESIYYWAAKNNIPVFCPMLLDGSTGDIMFFHKWKKNGLIVDIMEDTYRLNNMAIESKKTGALILGAGVVKHMINNANMMKEGTNYTVYINTSAEYDGSDAGAEPEEAISWGKIAQDADHIKVTADATIVLPLIVASVWKK